MVKTENRFKLARTKYNRNGKQSVKTVSEETGITRSLIDDLESNVLKKRSVGYLTVAKLAKYYGVTSDFLLELDDYPTIDVDERAACRYTGLSEKAITMLHEWQGSDDRRKLWGNYISYMIEAAKAEELLGKISELIAFSKHEIKAVDNNDLALAIDMIDMQMARQWHISRLFSDIIDELCLEIRTNKEA